MKDRIKTVIGLLREFKVHYEEIDKERGIVIGKKALEYISNKDNEITWGAEGDEEEERIECIKELTEDTSHNVLRSYYLDDTAYDLSEKTIEVRTEVALSDVYEPIPKTIEALEKILGRINEQR